MMRTRLTPAVAAAVLGLAVAAAPASAAPAPAAKPADIDVVLCLDVSGSMNGLIDSAKVKLWDIVNDLGKVKPAPNLRVALYSYGHQTYDPNKGWVRKELDLTTDLDMIYKKLNALTISGGTELVARVSRDAVAEQKWSDDKKALRLIFVCGNEPATQDKTLPLEDVAKMAVAKGIVINTIFCGTRFGDGKDWEQLAKLAEGRFNRINQDAGAVAIATPHDKKLAALSARINSTYVAWGKEKMRRARIANQAAGDKAAAGEGAAAGRAVTKGGALYKNSEWDLVDKLKADPKFDITKIPEEQLCDELKKLKPRERVKYVKDKMAEREKIQKEIQELAKKRAEYIRAEMKKQAKDGDKVFDEAVRATLREQAARKGITIPK